MSKRLKKIQDVVLECMREDEKARNSDDYLYYMVCMKKNPSILNKTFGHALLSFSDYQLPTFESVGRIRRKMQALYPELKPSDQVADFRLEREIMFNEYAREVR